MKNLKITAVALVALASSTASFAQTIPSTQVPQAVKATFEKNFPAVKKVKWEKEKGDFEAGFKQGKTEMSALFKADGSLSETEKEIETTELPGSAMAYLKDHYKGVKIKEAAKITKANGEVNYEAEVKGKDVLFDSKGSFIKVAAD
ncbi:MAG: PepSY-like domain-containing protein [Mucilaginibacter sp.]|nr:PepSY-like domain-containing protein [Mucilaginibacter sp.]